MYGWVFYYFTLSNYSYISTHWNVRLFEMSSFSYCDSIRNSFYIMPDNVLFPTFQRCATVTRNSGYYIYRERVVRHRYLEVDYSDKRVTRRHPQIASQYLR